MTKRRCKGLEFTLQSLIDRRTAVADDRSCSELTDVTRLLLAGAASSAGSALCCDQQQVLPHLYLHAAGVAVRTADGAAREKFAESKSGSEQQRQW